MITVDPEFEDDDYSLIPPSSLSTAEASRVEIEMPLAWAGQRLDQALAALLPEYSRSRLAVLIKESAVLVDGAPVAAKHKVKSGERVAITLKPREQDLAFRPEAIPLDIVYQDDALMVIDKPAGLVVHPAAGNWSGTLLNALLHHDPELARVPRAGIVHRLDKDTSGLMAVARTEAAQLDLVRQLQARTVKREYLALVQGNVRRDGTVDAPIGRHPRVRTKMAIVGNGKPAITHYRVLERMPLHSLLECRLETGRTHQIRVHMQSIGHPIEGDLIYGAKAVAAQEVLRDAIKRFNRQALHARRLAFVHPVSKKALNFEAPVPDDMQELIRIASET
jgi:23S rRNA pseudouridine1911/1915/1917 synthase